MYEMIVVFAHWCPKCNMMMSIVDDIEVDYAETLRIQRIDAEKHPEVMEQYQIEIVPTFIISFQLSEIGRMAGLISEDTFRHRIETLIQRK
jgi:thioredoxin 1